jgi:hypothetical protein
VLVVRVHPELRYDDINAFERTCPQRHRIVKFFLHVSKEEQKKRFLERLDEPEKNWKFSAADARERQHWDAYMDAYEDMIRTPRPPTRPGTWCRRTTSGSRGSWWNGRSLPIASRAIWANVPSSRSDLFPSAITGRTARKGGASAGSGRTRGQTRDLSRSSRRSLAASSPSSAVTSRTSRMPSALWARFTR